MKGYLKYLIFLGILILVLLWIAGFFSSKIKTEEVKPRVQKVTGLKFAPVEKREVVENTYTGEVIPEDKAEIATKLSGRITAVKVKEGDCVKTGALLIAIEGTEVSSQVEALSHQERQSEANYLSLKATFEANRRTFERYEKLLKEGAVTPQEFDEVKARYESSKEALEAARAGISAIKSQKRAVSSQLQYLNLRAPFSGCVIEKKVNPGDLAIPGEPLLVLEKPPYQIRAEIPARFFHEISPGKGLFASVEGLSERIKGEVIEKSSGLNPQTQTFTIKLKLKSIQGLKSGLIAKVFIPEKRTSLYIPEKAILRRYDLTGVFVLKPDKTLELRYVKTGVKGDGEIEILSGLKEGESIVVEGLERACDHCLVE
jgi:RND family efflux transporter MFP subunit